MFQGYNESYVNMRYSWRVALKFVVKYLFFLFQLFRSHLKHNTKFKFRFRCGTRNDYDCRNCGEMDLSKRYLVVTPWIRGCGHDAS